MRHIILGFVAVAFGFLLGIAYSLVALPEPAIAENDQSRTDLLLLKRMDSLAAQLAQRDEQAAGHARQVTRAVSSLRDQIAGLAVPGRAGGSLGGSSPGSTGRQGDGAAPADLPQKLGVFRGWESDTTLRAKWSGTTADDLRSAFGPPARMERDADGDALSYAMTDKESCRFLLVSGRVAAVSIVRIE